MQQSLDGETTVQLYAILISIVVLLNFFFGDKHEPKVITPLSAQIKHVYKNEKLWFLSLFYFLTFGSFVAFTVYLPNFLVEEFSLDKVDAGIRTAGFIAIATFLRPVGGWLGDRFNSFKILIGVFIGLTLSGILLAFNPSLLIVFSWMLNLLPFVLGSAMERSLNWFPCIFQKKLESLMGL